MLWMWPIERVSYEPNKKKEQPNERPRGSEKKRLIGHMWDTKSLWPLTSASSLSWNILHVIAAAIECRS